MREAFEREVDTWISLEKHPNIVYCAHLVAFNNVPFMMLEWVASDESRGTDLRSWLCQGPMELRMALDFTIDICRGLVHADRKQPGIVHRDLKPANILIGQGRIAKITDFGLAKVIEESEFEFSRAVNQTGPAGTPLYMAPEQWQTGILDSRADLYAVGLMLQEMLLGYHPFIGMHEENALDMLQEWHMKGKNVVLLEEIPSELTNILNRCLQKDRDTRFANVAGFLKVLSQFYVSFFGDSPRKEVPAGEFTTMDYNNRAIAYKNLGLFDKAYEDYEKALGLDPLNVYAYINRGLAFHDQDRYNEALADYNRALELDPDDGRIYNNRGALYNDLKQYDAAFADFSRSFELDPNNAKLYSNRGLTYQRMGKYREAFAEYQKALEINPGLVEAYVNRGIIYYDLDFFPEALFDFYKALELGGNYVDLYVNLGAVLATLGSIREALPYFEKAAEMGDSLGAKHAREARAMLGLRY